MPINDPDPFEERTTATIAEAFDVMVDASGIVKRNATLLTRSTQHLERVIRPLIWVVGVAFLVSMILVGQIVFRDNRIEELEGQITTLDSDVKIMQKAAEDARLASQEAKIAAESADAALKAAIANSQRSTDDSNEAIKRINEIYDTCVIKKEC